MTTPTYHPGDRVRVRAETAGSGIGLRKYLRTVATVEAGPICTPGLRRIRFDPIREDDAGLVTTAYTRDLEPAP